MDSQELLDLKDKIKVAKKAIEYLNLLEKYLSSITDEEFQLAMSYDGDPFSNCVKFGVEDREELRTIVERKYKQYKEKTIISKEEVADMEKRYTKGMHLEAEIEKLTKYINQMDKEPEKTSAILVVHRDGGVHISEKHFPVIKKVLEEQKKELQQKFQDL